MNISILLPILVPAMKTFIDGLVKGETLKPWQVQAIQMTYASCLIYADGIVADTENDLDNKAVELFKALAIDTAKEGHFPLLVFATVR